MEQTFPVETPARPARWWAAVVLPAPGVRASRRQPTAGRAGGRTGGAAGGSARRQVILLAAYLAAGVAGGWFGLSYTLAWRSWYVLNLALGALFLPLALAAAVRLRRAPGRRRALALGAVLGCALLTDQESAVLAATVTALALVPWLLAGPSWAKARAAALAAAAAVVVASPQLAAMIRQVLTGGASLPLSTLA